MEAVVKTGIQSTLNIVRSVGNENKKLKGRINGLLKSLEIEVRMAKWDEKDYEGVDQKLAVDMQELLFDIDDFLCDLSIPEGFAAFWHNALGMDSRNEDIPMIHSFITSVQSIRQRQAQIGSGAKEVDSSFSSAGSPPVYAPEAALVGFPETKVNFLKLLSPGVDKPRVVSIVGCNGVGKTALARAVFEEASTADQSTHATKILLDRSTYQSEIREESAPATDVPAAIAYDCKAWVVASTCSDWEDLLNKVLEEVGSKEAPRDTAKVLESFLKDKRYLVIIDDLQPYGVKWRDIEHAFPQNNKGSKIIVTTNVHSIAKTCSPGSHYVYPMQCLNRDHSSQLILNTIHGSRSYGLDLSDAERPRLERICDRCGDLPLALISVANYMGGNGQDLSEDACKDVCETLGNYLKSKEMEFDELKRALMQRYEKLPDNGEKNCLLYVSIFPRGYQISWKSLARRLVAEEFVVGDAEMEKKIEDVGRLLKQLIDRSMIEPVMPRNNSQIAKRCKVHSAMQDFTIQKSLSKNLVTLIARNEYRQGDHEGRVRRLTVESSTSSQSYDCLRNKSTPNSDGEQSKLPSVRSLTMFKSEIMDTQRCKFMRVLDLEGCGGLDKKVLGKICELVFLKYLRLSNSNVKELPEELEKLKYLQTLDMGDALIPILLPVVVIMLPELVYLFGRFLLPLSTSVELSKLKKFLESRSQLHTLAGIVFNENEVLATIIQKAKNLKKVKIWSMDTSPSGTIDPASGSSHPDAPIGNTSALDAPKTILYTAAAASNAARHIDSLAPGNVTALVSPRKSKRWYNNAFFRLLVGSEVSKHNHATFNRQATSNELSGNPPVSPCLQPSFSKLDGPAPSETSVAKKSLADVFVCSGVLESLYIESNDFCNVFLDSLKATCRIGSIKLRGELVCLPQPNILKGLRGLSKLHLYLSGLSCQALSALQNLLFLEYLAIVEERDGSWNDSFIVEDTGFPCLKVLCFEGPKHPQVEIKPGGMQHLTSIKLLCRELPPDNDANKAAIECPPRFKGISHLAKLNEVILHHDAAHEKLKSWKEAAMSHANMPRVRKQPAPEPILNAP
ncbi:disease resistance protein RGA4-like [Triticum dicoccoides]|uniref:disease resistance protein RGA4-like n=1 Tax=Triticum dicoccoides TaxID=85692 RepID=UPI00188E226A|nr:disease resistance protein RGA4-like [Triticum dicoccoides]